MRKWFNREYLIKNKIYFEIFSYSFLGLASLFLGGASIYVSYLSWQTSERQLELYEIEKRPVINTKLEMEKSGPVVNIYNVGPPAFNIRVLPVSVIVFKNIKYSTPTGEDPSLFIYFNDFYNNTNATSNISGKIATVAVNKKAWKAVQKKNSLLSKQSSHQGLILSHYQLLDVLYEDDQRNTYRKFYQILHGSAFEISIKRYNKLLHEAEAINMTNSEFEKIGIKEIRDMIPMKNVIVRENFYYQNQKNTNQEALDIP